jgi:hypothetical protein
MGSVLGLVAFVALLLVALGGFIAWRSVAKSKAAARKDEAFRELPAPSGSPGASPLRV